MVRSDPRWFTRSLTLQLLLCWLLVAGSFAAVTTQAQTITTNCATQTDVPQAECEALLTLYTTTNGTNWTNDSGWGQNTNVCSWHGVTCTNGSVTGLFLQDNQLSGSISPQISNLTNLRTLYLHENLLVGSIPPELGSLSNLQTLSLFKNQLSGSIPPALANLTNVSTLYLSGNQLDTNVTDPELLAWLITRTSSGWRDQNTPIINFTSGWTSVRGDDTLSVAWGDYDNDGDLDLAVGNSGNSQIYRNDNGNLSSNAVWSSADGGAYSVAWGDVDGDGDLDLVVGERNSSFSSSSFVRLYRNDNGVLTSSAIWSSTDGGASSVAWGDVDGDGDLDLAVSGDTARLYRNDRGILTQQAVWSAGIEGRDIAWGDYDNDGDLDLAVGTQLYRNDGGRLTDNPVWTPQNILGTPTSIAWGDYDNDGDLDLAVGNLRNESIDDRSHLYRNDNGVLTPAPVWYSANVDATFSVAWGDVDNDGYLDLVVGNDFDPVRIYRNYGGVLSTEAAWSSPLREPTSSIALADIDGDGDLDLVVGNGSAELLISEGTVNRIYQNKGNIFRTPKLGSYTGPLHSTNSTESAQGDVDNDGDLDLAVATETAIKLSRNDARTLTTNPIWSSTDGGGASVLWGDVDGDGDPDLAVGTYDGPNRLYRNDNGVLTSRAVWVSVEADRTQSIAWGDYDGDGDLDLAVGNKALPIRIYRNDNGTLTTAAVWSSQEAEGTEHIIWGDVDGDGDLDLIATDTLYINESTASIPVLRKENLIFPISSTRPQGVTSLGIGDVDGDGDFDLVVVGDSVVQDDDYIYEGARNDNLQLYKPASVRIQLPSTPDTVFLQPIIAVPYVLTHPQSTPVRALHAFFSLDGGGVWKPARGSNGTHIVTDPARLTSSPAGIRHTYEWDTFASGFFGQSDTVVLRFVAYPDYRSRPSRVAGPFMYSYNATQSFPIRVRGTQVRVLTSSTPVTDALVYRQPATALRASPVSNRSGQPFRTNLSGFLQGRGELAIGDHLIALKPISATASYTLYHTSAAPNSVGLDAFRLATPGIQQLAVSPSNPLLLFNLNVVLEWDARNDPAYMARLSDDLRRTSAILYDWTNGQAALGDVTIYHDRGPAIDPETNQYDESYWWNRAHIRIYASNRLRPNANQGGIITEERDDPTVPNVLYTPGQVRMGAIWNRYGEAESVLGEDWPRTLAHELGHFLFFLDDNYLGLDADGRIIPVSTCPGAMSDPYLDNTSEFHPSNGWLPGCAQTFSQQETGRSDWATLQTFYPMLNAPQGPFAQVNAGPISFPLEATTITVVGPDTPSRTLPVPILYLVDPQGQGVIPDRTARAILYQAASQSAAPRLLDLGSPALDRVEARGARPGDELCVYNLTEQRIGCETIRADDQQLTLSTLTQPWQPEITITPVTSRTLVVTVTQVPANLQLQAQLFPTDDSAPPMQTLTVVGDAHATTFTLAEPAFSGVVRVWVNEPAPRRETVSDYTIGGNPGFRRSRRTPGDNPGFRRSRRVPRNNPGFRRSRRAPALSSDGQAILYGKNLDFADDQFFALQATEVIAPPIWATPIGRAYRLSGTANVPELENAASLLIGYLSSDVPPGEEEWIKVYFREPNPARCGVQPAPCWRPLPTTLDVDQNTAAAPTQGLGVYALMSSLDIPLSGPGWNNIAYPVRGTRPVTEAFASIAGQFSAVWHFDTRPTRGADDPIWGAWKVYHPQGAAWSNDLTTLSFGSGYWINVNANTTLSFAGKRAEKYTPLSSFAITQTGHVPALYYGAIHASDPLTPTAGMPVAAYVGDVLCGTGTTQMIAGQVVYRVVVVHDGMAGLAGCGASGRAVTLRVNDTVMTTSLFWDNAAPRRLSLPQGTPIRISLPLIVRGQ